MLTGMVTRKWTVFIFLILLPVLVPAGEYPFKTCVPIHFGNSFPPENPDNGAEEELCTTSGDIEVKREWEGKKMNFLWTDSPQTRAVLNHNRLSSIGLCFSNLDLQGTRGQNDEEQIGLKLRAQNTCNLLYVMWRFHPENKIVITRKLNKGDQTHKECLNHGYKTLAVIPMGEPEKSENTYHSIMVQIKKNQLIVFADGKEVWTGVLEKEVLALRGPMGIRSDNGAFVFQMDNWDSVRKNCPLGGKG